MRPNIRNAEGLTFICEIHGEQEFDYFIYSGIVLKCGCAWHAIAGTLTRAISNCPPSQDFRAVQRHRREKTGKGAQREHQHHSSG